MLDFDAETHTYHLDGIRVPSVTQIVNAVVPFGFAIDPWYLKRGTALHRAIDLFHAGRLDETTIDESYAGKFDAYQKFRAETKCETAASEIALGSKRYMFAGTLDAILMFDGCDLVLGDWKGSVTPSADLQLGGYSILLKESGEKIFSGVNRGVGVQLNDDGSYKCRWIDSLKKQERYFLACLTVYNWMVETGKAKI